jgi:CubicO group peptidase (beta-lactamase class C family)
MRTFFFLLILCAPGIAHAQEKAAKLAEQEDVASGIRLLQAWIDSQKAYRGLPGLSIAIVHDQDTVWSRGFGHADLDKKTATTPGTVYRIASISKTFTATAIMQLRDQGKHQEAVFPPETKWKYSNLGLALDVERAIKE